MPIISFSDRDILRGTVVTPGWYRCKVNSVGEAPTVTAKGPSINYPVECTVLFNGDTGDTKYANVPIDFNFNSKAIGFAAGFLKAFGVDVQANKRFDLNAAADKEVDIFIGNKEFQGRMLNDPQHQYRAPLADVKPVETVSA